MDDVDRMYRHLVRTIRATSPQLLTQPFPVAELYQTILPYRLHRRELGLETNQDYEMAMLELLSGGRGYLAVDERMREVLGTSFKSPNPDPALIRDFAAARVALAPEALQRLGLDGHVGGAGGVSAGGAAGAAEAAGAAAPTAPMPAATTPIKEPDTAPFRASATATTASSTEAMTTGASASSPTGPRPSAAAMSPSSSASAPSAGASTGGRRPPRPITVSPTGEQCGHCSGELPAGRQISFCPHCGQDLTIVHCPACGSELEHDWKFCVACGRASGS